MQGRVAARRTERQDKASEFSDKSSEISDAMRLVRIAAEPRPVGDSVKAAIRRAANVLQWAPGRTRDVWYGEVRRVDSREMDVLRSIERRQNLRFLESDYRKHVEQLAALRARLQSRDEAFHSPDILAITFLLNELQTALQR